MSAVVGWLSPVSPPAVGAPALADGRPVPRTWLVVGNTVIPQLAMGVRRPGFSAEVRDARDVELRDMPTAADVVSATQPLFQPLPVLARHEDGVGTVWYLLGRFTAGPTTDDPVEPLGWAQAERLELLPGRGAVSFATEKRLHGVDMFASADAAYTALVTQTRQPSERVPNGVLVKERTNEDRWDPSTSDRIVPFIELPTTANPELPDTPVTFHPGLEGIDNRLVHLGAVCGGPVDLATLKEKQHQLGANKPLEMLFVIDETLSMEKYFPEVATYIERNLVPSGAAPVRATVSWYRDRAQPGDTPYEVSPLAVLAGKPQRDELAARVRTHRPVTVTGDGAQPEELPWEGVAAAIDAAKFTAGGTAIVVVIGDAGDRNRKEDLKTRLEGIGDRIVNHGLQMACIRVGSGQQAFHKSFDDQVGQLQAGLPENRRGDVVLESADANGLGARLAAIQREAENRRERLRREIAEMESRNRFTAPGPLLTEQIKADGLSPAEFDARSLQYFVPACGWLYHPLDPNGPQQLRQLVWLQGFEARALAAAFKLVERQLSASSEIDAEAVVDQLGTTLAGGLQQSVVATRLRERWDGMPPADRSLGILFRDVVGLPVRNPLFYARVGTRASRVPKATVDSLRRSIDAFAGAAARATSIWYDTQSLP